MCHEDVLQHTTCCTSLLSLLIGQRENADVLFSRNAFVFQANTTSASSNFTIIDDDVCEYNQLLRAEFDFGTTADIASRFNARKGNPAVTYLVIEDDDSEYILCIYTHCCGIL